MRTTFLAPLVALALGAAAPALADTIRVGTSGGYFPFTFTQADKLQGFEIDFLNAIGEATGHDIEFVTMSFSGQVGALEAGRIDTIANQITVTPEREAKFGFTQPYVYDGAQIVVRKGNPKGIAGPDTLSGKSVAVNLGSNFEQLLRNLPNAADIDIRTYETNLEQDVALGRVDAFVMDRVSTAQVIAKSPAPLEQAGKPFDEIRNALPFRKDPAGEKLRAEVDAAITKLKDSGKLAEISQKWLADDVTKPAQ